jgi:hypothetical protein
MQIDALNRQRQFVFQNLDPSVIGPQATQADVNNAVNRLALQGQIDPNLLNSRYAAEAGISNQLGQVGQGNAAKISNIATNEATQNTPGMETAKDTLVKQAQQELDAGATLPPDVQAELVKAGLERSGMVTQSASGQGTGGQILRTILGTAGLQLKQQRQQQATGLLSAAQNLTNSRASILSNLFPNLNSTQLNNLTATSNAFNTANSALPSAGLSGSDIANIWLARVGATNQLAQNAANAGAAGALGQGQAWSGALGANSGNIGNGLSSAWNNVSGWFGPSYQNGVDDIQFTPESGMV